MKPPSRLEIIAEQIIRSSGIPGLVPEYRFHPDRKWRFDFAFPDLKIAIECEGAVYSRGRHTRGSGYIADTEKYNEAAILGWIVLRYTYQTLNRICPDLKRVYTNSIKK